MLPQVDTRALLAGEPRSDSHTRSMDLTRATAVVLLLVLSALIYLGNAGFPPLLDDADSSHAMVSHEMLQRHDWVILYMNGIRYLMKAPLHYWAVAMSYAAFGQNEFSTRLPVALAMIGLALLVNEFARRFFGVRAGFYSGLVVCTSAGFFLFTRIMIPEAIYALEFTAIFYLFLRGWTGSLDPRAAYWGAAALTGLAMLTRGLVGVIFPTAILFLFIVATRSWNRWRELHLFSSAAMFLLIAAPWHILASLRASSFFWSYFINEHLKRAIGTRYPPDYEAVPLWLWLGAHLVWFFPWSIFLPGVLKLIPPPRTWKNLPADGQARLLLVLWAGFILLFFSLTFGSRMEYYSFGAWPAMAMLLGISLAKAEEEGKRWLVRVQAALAVVGAALAAVLIAMLWISAKVQVIGDISSLLKEHENNFYRVSMAHILDLTPQAFALLRLPAALAAAAFLFGLTAAWWLRREGRGQSAAICLATTMAVFFFAANIALGVFGPYLSSRPLTSKVLPEINAADTLALYGEFDAMSGVAFYTDRQLLLWNGRYNNLAAGSHYPDAPHIFLTDPEFAALWKGPKRVFLFVPSEHRAAAAQRLPAQGTFLVAESGGKAVYANRPAASVAASQ
ncbi:MAG TPA: glycosyltransferase family 39 protein [Candidatus Saccharimonadales bacterium]|nr:glycosyltransferase family 39 protein [Candidatus Saccharimonadales bacterium]